MKLYFLSEPGEERVPSNGSGAGDDCVTASNCPPTVAVPGRAREPACSPCYLEGRQTVKKARRCGGNKLPAKGEKDLISIRRPGGFPDIGKGCQVQNEETRPPGVARMRRLDIRTRVKPHMRSINGSY